MDTESEISEGFGTLRMTLRERPRKLSAERKLRERIDELKFLGDFNPEKSNREKRKQKRKCNNTSSRSSLYDENGHIRHNGLDVCDCMSTECPGCWFECENCGSTKCGIKCRVNRKVYFESIAFDGKDTTIKNPHFPAK